MPPISALLLVLVTIELVQAANETRVSPEMYQSDQRDNNATSLAKIEEDSETSDTAIGESRVGGDVLDNVPSWLSVLLCPKEKTEMAGNLCGMITWIDGKRFLASNNAIYKIQEQLGDKWEGPPAGWKISPPRQFDRTVSLDSEEDWRYRFKFVKTIDRGLGVWERLGHESTEKLKQRIVNKPEPGVTARAGINSPYDFTANSGNDCYVMVYSGQDKGNNLSLSKINVKKGNCDFRECEFEAVSVNNRVGSLCGNKAHIGAPIMCHGDSITHIVIEVRGGERGCHVEFTGLTMAGYKSDLN